MIAAAASATAALTELDSQFTVLSETGTGLNVTIGAVFSPVEIGSPYDSVTFTLP